MTEVVFCESEAEVGAALEAPGSGDRIIVPLTPSAAARLAGSGIRYRRMEDFYSESPLCAGARKRLGRLVEWADSLDACLAERLPEFREPKFAPARLYLFFLAWLANALFFRAHALDALGKALRPDLVAWSAPPREEASLASDLGYWTSSASLWPPVIAAWARARGLDARRLAAVTGAASPAGDLADRWVSIGYHRRLLRREGLAGYWRHVGGRVGSAFARRLAGRASPAGAILFLQDNYDLREVRRTLQRRGHRCVTWEELRLPPVPAAPIRDLAPRLARFWDEAGKLMDLFAPFRVGDIELGEVAAPRLRCFVEKVIPEMYGHFVRARALFGASRPRAVLAPYAEAAWQAPTLQAARTTGVPAVVYQHGGFQGACELPIWRETDRYVADYVFVYGDGVRSCLEEEDRRLGPPRARTVVVGSARLDALRRRPGRAAVAALRRAAGVRDPATVVVLYVPYMLRGNLRYLSCDDYPDVWFYELQTRVVELFREFPGAHLVYKRFSDAVRNPVPEAARSLPNVSVIGPVEMRVTRLMWAADAILLDIPSTALLECLLTPKPLVVFADRDSLRMREEAKMLLRRRAPLAETPDDFVAEVRRLLAERRFSELERPDESFLRAYGTHLGDGRSAERAVAAIGAITEEAPSAGESFLKDGRSTAYDL